MTAADRTSAADQAPGTALEAALAQLVQDARRRRLLAHDVTTGNRWRLLVDRRTGRGRATDHAGPTG